MSSSDFGDSDDDDELLQALIHGRAEIQNHQIIPTQANVPTQTQQGLREVPTNTTSDSEIQSKLYRADGEISILRIQLQQLQQQKQQDINKLNDSYNALKRNNEEQIIALKQAVVKLEDEKKFLNSELVIASSSDKKRKLVQFDTPPETVPSEPVKELVEPPKPRILKPSNDVAFFSDQIWNYCIPGSSRTSLTYLSKICTDFDIHLTNFKLLKQTAISSSIMEFLITRKNLRLDQLIEQFVTVLLQLITEVLDKSKSKSCVAVPFLISLIHCSISFRPVAVSIKLIEQIVTKLSSIAQELSYLVSEGLEEEVMDYNGDFITYHHDVPNHVIILQKFIFICCMDTLEKAVILSSMYEPQTVRNIWKLFPRELFNLCLPENPERFKNTAQINLVYNMVEMLSGSITDEETFAFNNPEVNSIIISSLLKVCLIELPIREDFRVYGLNRIIGNNFDLAKIDSMIPLEHDCLNNYLIVIPQPISYELLEPPSDSFELASNHQFHLLTLSVKVSELFHSLIVTQETVDFLYNKEHFKSMIRIIGFEQDSIMKSPRSKYIYLRLQLVSNFVKIINYLTQQEQTGRDMTDLIYPETMHEVFVVLSRIAFGSDSTITSQAHDLLVRIRQKGNFNQVVFNQTCESRARELNHLTDLTSASDGKLLADLQADFANGLEFPYDSDTIECAREILNRFVTDEEADNLYFNMNCEEHHQVFDEMELVE
ncbi:DNA damage checkpoint protein [Spathaspora sp. JA1]|nr:DNA damage checkpoint protein [Spathaspora sp. JA1]